MKNNDLLKYENSLIRVLDIKETSVLVIDCNKKSMPKWVSISAISEYEICSDYLFELSADIESLEPYSRKTAYKRFTLISRILPYIYDKKKRCGIIAQIAEENDISTQTICNYLWAYLVYQNIAALAPKSKEKKNEITADEKNFRWALNKFFYTKNGNSLSVAYSFMLEKKYCDEQGKLLSQYPTFNQFRYYYRKNKSMQQLFISRNGIKSYQRNNRPLLGDGIREFAPFVGTGTIDATVCDIYLIDDCGNVIGRPVLTACIDAYSGLCCGYSLTLEGGVYSLRSLMLNVITDKVEWCKKFGIKVDKEFWNCDKLPATLVTDMGKEYVSETFEQITDLGATVINLPSYRPDLKGAVEKFFDIIQGLYKPYLKNKGVIEPDFRERGSHDYRKDAALTMNDFEKIIIRCIIYYNSQKTTPNFPYSEDMIKKEIKPYPSAIWNYGLTQNGTNLITIDCNTLILTLLPRTIGKFSRKGLIVNKLRYKNEKFTERYLNGGTVTVSYNPEDISQVWLIENGYYTPFDLIENRFTGKGIYEVNELKNAQNTILKEIKTDNIQAKIDLANNIEIIANSCLKQGNKATKGIKENRRREQIKRHIDYLKDV